MRRQKKRRVTLAEDPNRAERDEVVATIESELQNMIVLNLVECRMCKDLFSGNDVEGHAEVVRRRRGFSMPCQALGIDSAGAILYYHSDGVLYPAKFISFNSDGLSCAAIVESCDSDPNKHWKIPLTKICVPTQDPSNCVYFDSQFLAAKDDCDQAIRIDFARKTDTETRIGEISDPEDVERQAYIRQGEIQIRQADVTQFFLVSKQLRFYEHRFGLDHKLKSAEFWKHHDEFESPAIGAIADAIILVRSIERLIELEGSSPSSIDVAKLRISELTSISNNTKIFMLQIRKKHLYTNQGNLKILKRDSEKLRQTILEASRVQTDLLREVSAPVYFNYL